MAAPKKAFALRLDPALHAAIERLAAAMAKSGYGEYLLRLVHEGRAG